ncbi:hypothetical protein QLX08_006945 [Tetragonisca angustula]|uniref:C2H2-type domain-containing protein n=1 Tax=Tetragonisca angustula TaxID=166442 RepID=A0AAW0ZSN9_9HYME
MSVLYECIICHQSNATVVDLHNHHIEHHSLKELSQTIINLQGFKILNNTKFTEKKYLQPINVGDNNNNENICNHVFIEPESKYKYKNKVTSSPRKFTHDNCSINCSQFIAWERELYQRKEINDEDFFNITESLCWDLSKSRKKRRGRKKKHITGTKETDLLKRNLLTRNQIDEIIGVKNEPAEQIKTEIKDTNKTEVVTSVKVVNTDTDNSVVTYYSSCNNSPWNSIISVSGDEQEMSADEKNVYPQSVEIDIANFL